MATLTSQLILSLVDKVTAPARGIAGAVSNLQGRLEENNRRLDAMRGRMVEAVAVAYGLGRAIAAPIQAAMEFESAMADVRKVVDFPTPEAFKDMSAQIIEMSTQIPIAATGIADIVAAAGQAGMAGNDLLAFAEVAAKVGVAFDMTAGDVGTALAKIKTALRLSVADTSALADAINHLSNTSASSAPDIVNFMSRVGAAGSQYGFLPEQTAAIGSAMIAAGAEAQVAATSFLNVGRALARGESATARQSAAFKQLGLDAADVAKRLQEDAVGTLRDVIVRINELPEHLRATTLSDLFGDEARALAPLVTQIELYDQAIAAVSEKANYLGSSQKEFEVRSETTANTLQLLRNKVSAVGIAIGSALLPAINSIAEALGPVIMALARFADQNPRLTATVIALAAGLVALRVAAIAAQFAFLWMRGGVLMAGIAGLRGLQGAATLTSLTFWPLTASLRATRTAMLGFAASAAIAGRGGALKIMAGAILGLLNPLRLVRASLVALKFAVIGTGIGAVLVAIASAGAWIYQNWQGIKEMFAGIGEGIRSAFPGLSPIIDAVSNAVGTLFGWFQKLTGPVDATSQEWRALGVTIGTTIGEIVAKIAALPAQLVAYAGQMVAAGTSLIQSLLDGAVAAATALPEWIASLLQGISSKFADLPSRLYQAIISSAPVMMDGGIALMNMLLEGLKAGATAVLNYVSDIGSRIGSAISNAASGAWEGVKNRASAVYNYATGANVEAKAAGGPIVGGRTYLVGEEGPELITPSRSGYVHTADETAGMSGAGREMGAQGGITLGTLIGELHVHPSPGMNEQALAEKTARLIDKALKDAFSGGHWNGGYRVA